MEKNTNYFAALCKIIAAIVLVLLGVITLFSSVYTIKDTETAVVTTFGKAEVNNNKGIQWKIPFIQKVSKVSTTTYGFTIGYVENEDGTEEDVEEEAEMITNDYNFVDADFYVSYRVSDPIKYKYASNDPITILKNIAMSCIRSTMSAYTVDSALTTGKSEIQSNIRQMIVNKLEKEDIGLVLDDILMQDVEPPTTEVSNAFKAVETAKQGKESAINEANKYRNEQLPTAEATVDKIIQEAEATKTARINEATGQVARFNAQYTEYQKYPLITKQRMFYETMEELLPKMKVIIDDGNGNIQKYYPVESFATFNTNTADTTEAAAEETTNTEVSTDEEE
ncbi:MAG: FtsH protease activity modulator HflK [Lachnospiraceae bacterium]|nr:FtsH protease activity modulator HflK [Lachnospiraceae bacterium]